MIRQGRGPGNQIEDFSEHKRGLLDGEPLASDDDLRRAIEQLEASTAAIEKQASMIKLQQASLSSLVHDNLARDKGFDKASNALERKWMHESQHLAFVSEELTSETSAMLKTLDEHVMSAIKAIKSTITALLKSHDRILERLDGNEVGILADNLDERYSMGRVEKLSSILVSLSEQEIRCRLDRIYLEAIMNEPDQEAEDDAQKDEHEEAIASLEASIPPLHSEINTVAEMAVNQAYSEPLLCAIDQADQISRSQAVLRQKYLSSTLNNLTGSTNDTADRLLQFHSFRTALANMQRLMSDVVKADAPLSPSKQVTAPRSSHDLRGRPALQALLQNLSIPTTNFTPSFLTTQATHVSHSTRALDSGLQMAISSHLVNRKMAITRINDASQNANDMETTGGQRSAGEEADDLSSRVGEVGKWVEKMGGRVDEMGKDEDRSRDALVERWTAPPGPP